jgi:hypothetical protein
VRKRTLINLTTGFTLIMFFTLVIFGTACSSARSNDERSEAVASRSGDAVTITGCLNGTQDNRFALTSTSDAVGAIAGRAVAGDERETHSYILIGGDNLQQHIGRRVEVVGTLSGGSRQVEHDDKAKAEVPNATGGDDKPTVKTTEEVEVQVRQLNVSQVRPVEGDCKLTQ